MEYALKVLEAARKDLLTNQIGPVRVTIAEAMRSGNVEQENAFREIYAEMLLKLEELTVASMRCIEPIQR